MERIGRYEIEGELGRGAMGVVFRARDPAIGRTVAIKTIRMADIGDVAERERMRNRLLHEARSAGTLSHPGIVTVYDVGEHDDIAYVAMEFVNGPTIEAVFSGAEPPNASTVFRILQETAAALDYAHKRGIVHRDIKPANIMIHEDGAVKITDFGVAKIPASLLATQAGSVVGTPCYMSPEQALGRSVDGRSDQFSLAVVAFEMITGQKPFGSENLATVIYKIAHEDPPACSKLNSTLVWQVDVVLARALQKGPAARFPTCGEFASALENACRASKGWKPLPRTSVHDLPTLEVRKPVPPVAAAPAPAPQPKPAAPHRGAKKVLTGLLLVAASVVLLASVAWLNHWFKTGAQQPPSTAEPAQTSAADRPSPAGPAAAKPYSEPAPGETPPEAIVTQPVKASETKSPEPKEPELPAEVTALVRTTPTGASLVFDGRVALGCTSPCSMQLSPGRHTVNASLYGYKSALRIFQLPEEASLFLYLTKSNGQVQVISEPAGAAILVDGQRRAESTPATFELPVGKHTVSVTRDGYQPDQQEIDLKDSAFIRLRFTLGK